MAESEFSQVSEGAMATFKETALPHTQLLFDPNNYRFQDLEDFVVAEESRLHEESVQERAYRRTREDPPLRQLKNSILRNGFLPVERLVVKPYQYAENLFLVIEGNRRLAALRWVAEDHEAGVSADDRILQTLKNVPVIVVQDDTDDPAFQASLMGIRHVSGIKEWGGYQRAKLVADLRDNQNLDTADIADRLGMLVREVNRRYYAFRALQQMAEDEEYEPCAGPHMYPIFHEALAIPAIREWLGWDNNKTVFTNDDTLRQFYALIAPASEEGGETPEAKITSYHQVRQLRSILANPEAKRLLLDPSVGFLEAAAAASRDTLSSTWAARVAEAIAALNSIPLPQLRSLTADDVQEIERLRKVAEDVLSAYEKLKD